MEHGASDPHMILVQYICHIIQAHRVMTEFREAGFCWHTSMAPSVVNHFFEHLAAKLYMDVLKY